MQFANPAGFWAFLGAVALILIYLIRPKAKEINIPSLMFFMKETGSSLKKSFLEKLLRNFVFFLQLLALLALAFALTAPSINIGYDTTADNTVLIVDTSASMQTKDNSRFTKAITTAKNSLRGEISIIAAQSIPMVLLDKEGSGKANEILDIMRPGDTTSNIGDAMVLAMDLMKNREGRVVVLSDFRYTEGPDPGIVKKILETEGVVVDFVNVGTQGNNVGIIDVLLERHYAKAIIKNFNEEEKTVMLAVINDGQEIKTVSKTILPKSVENIEFETPAGLTIVEIKDKDDLDVDNTAYISAPEKAEIKTLLITNKPNTYFQKALEASKDIIFEVAEPPIIPSAKDFDVIIFNDVDEGKILSGTIEDISHEIEKNGKAFIIMAQDDLEKIDFKGLLPVELGEKVKGESTYVYDFSQGSEGKYEFAEEDALEYGTTTEYFNAIAYNESIVYAQTSENIPMVVSKRKGAGNAVYYGLFDDSSTFKSSPSYPLFWNRLINSLMGTEDITNFNFKTGKIMFFSTPTDVITPEGQYVTTRLIMDRAGFYEVAEKKYAVNIFDEKESDIASQIDVDNQRSESYQARKIERRKDVELQSSLLWFVLFAIITELLYIKYIGEI